MVHEMLHPGRMGYTLRMATPRKTKTRDSSSRTRAQRAGKANPVLPGRRGKAADAAVTDVENEQVYGVLLSGFRRQGENMPSTGAAKRRRT